MASDALSEIEKFETRLITGRKVEKIDLYEWAETYLKHMFDIYAGEYFIKTHVNISQDLVLLIDE